MHIETKFVKKNPSKLWKLNNSIKIKFDRAGIQEFECVKDERGEDYFYSKEANHSYHKRLFNRNMLVGVDEIIYSTEEIQQKALIKFMEADRKRNQAYVVLNMCQSSLEESKPIMITK